MFLLLKMSKFFLESSLLFLLGWRMEMIRNLGRGLPTLQENIYDLQGTLLHPGSSPLLKHHILLLPSSPPFRSRLLFDHKGSVHG